MIALLHDFLPRGAKRVLIAVAGIFGAAFSFAFVDMMPFLILKTVESTLSQIRRRRARGTSGLWPSSP